jgi:hypothetical protein
MPQPRKRERGQRGFPEGLSIGKTGPAPGANTAPAQLKGIKFLTIAVDPASIPTVSTGKIAVTITGLRVGDIVVAERPDTLNDDLVYGGCRVTGNDTLTLYLYNPTGGPIDDGSLNWNFLIFDMT